MLKQWICFNINSSASGQNGHHFADDMFKRIFLNENISISNKNSLKYVPWVLIDNDSIGSDKSLAPSRRQAIIWTNVDSINQRIYAALGESN